jgi:cellulose synthase/poly-beta-1,6-N-acetylglucosamine synthase-like glycosyltransferase
MEILNLIFGIIEIVVFIYFAFATFYIGLFGFGAFLPRRKKPLNETRIRKIAVMIPGYKEDMVIVDVAADALHQNYPKDKYEVIVIADSFKPETLFELRKLPIRVVEVVFEVSKKSKALNKCMEQIGDDFDIAMILDADNLMAPDVLSKINDAFNRGYLAVQGHRMAKNTNTDFAVLDAVSEEINNHIFRKGHRALGLSSALIGSGMGIDYALYKKTMATVDSVGEDKEVEMKLLKQKFVIEYVEDAFIYDEKTQKSEVFVNQRRRWLAAQLSHFREYFFDGLFHLFRYGNLDYFDKVLQMIQPPRILLLGLLFFITFFYALIELISNEYENQLNSLNYNHWLALLIISAITALISVPKRLLTKKTFFALLSLPKGFFLMILSLLKIRGATKRFIHTTHSHAGKVEKKH